MAYILVIDDEEEIRQIVRQVLELEGHEVQEACNGLEGIQLYRNFQVDLVITDILMPEKDGLETIKELRREFAQVKIIAMAEALSSSIRIDLLDMAKSLGAISVIRKPFSINELLGALKEAVETPTLVK